MFERCIPSSFIHESELENSVSVWRAESCCVEPGRTCDGYEWDADVWVQHREGELEDVVFWYDEGIPFPVFFVEMLHFDGVCLVGCV